MNDVSMDLYLNSPQASEYTSKPGASEALWDHIVTTMLYDNIETFMRLSGRADIRALWQRTEEA